MDSRSDPSRHERNPVAGPPETGPEASFGDLLNGFTLDSGRRRRRRGRHEPVAAQTAGEPQEAPAQSQPDIVELPADDPAAAAVRPYAWTRGRTTSQFRLELETLLSTTTAYSVHDDATPSEHHAVAALCHQPRSIAEVAALLHIPIGVARVLVGDMATDGLLAVHDTASVDGESPDLMLMERVLSGLRRL
jgi:hypothetical protein